MKNASRGQKGFTLLEIIVVLAVVGALAAMLAPVVFRYIDDAKRAQAQSDVSTIAAAIQQMYKDTGRWPFYKVGTGSLAKQAADTTLLTSNTGCVGATVTGTCDPTAPVDSGATWGLLAGKPVSLSDQLILNTPFAGTGTAYATTGARPWKGPYLDHVPALDPWGRSYLVNIGNADPSAEGFSTQKWVIAISAGPNGILDTAGDALGKADPQVAGDDAIVRVK